MIEWGCGWDMSCNIYCYRGEIFSRWWGMRMEVCVGDDLAEVVWPAEVDGGGVLRKL